MDHASNDNHNGLKRMIKLCLNIQKNMYNKIANVGIKKTSAAAVFKNAIKDRIYNSKIVCVRISFNIYVFVFNVFYFCFSEVYYVIIYMKFILFII